MTESSQVRDSPPGRGIRKNPVPMNRRVGCALVLLALLALPAAAQAKKPNGGTVWPGQIEALHRGQCGHNVATFNQRLGEMGYVANRGRCFKGKTERGVLAYRKVNGMARNEHAGKGLVKRVFASRGRYRVRHPGAGEHAEVPLDKQVLVLAKGSRPFAIYPVSTGKPSTPTVTGEYSFYRREPGYNAEGMYYSFYWHNGYAVHGYAEVPDYAASHGCVRTFIADQPRIYEQLKYGEPIFVF